MLTNEIRSCGTNAYCANNGISLQSKCVCKTGYIGNGYKCTLGNIFFNYLRVKRFLNLISIKVQTCNEIVCLSNPVCTTIDGITRCRCSPQN